MTECPTFSVTVTANDETSEFALGTDAVLGLVDSLCGDNPDFAGLFAAASTHPSARVRASAARKDCLPPDAAMELANDRCADVRRAVARHPMFRRLAGDDTILRMIASDPETAEIVAENLDRFERADIEAIGDALLKDADPMVRLRMAEGSCTPLKLLNRLCQDVAAEVAGAARLNLGTRQR